MDVIHSLLQERNWINYCPGKPFNLYDKNHVDEQQISNELTLLYNAGFRNLSSYGFFNGLENIPRIAKEIGFKKVISLLWWTNDTLYQLEKSNLKENAHYLDSILVGNEAVHKGGTDLVTLNREINALKNQYALPITTGLHRREYNFYPQQALDIGDYIMVNLQTWWVNIQRDPLDGAGWIKAVYTELLDNPFLPADKPVIIHEATWPCGNNIPEGVNEPQSYMNQMIFYQKLLEYEIPFIWSFSSDMYFAKIKSPPGGYGGLWTEDWQPKPIVNYYSQLFI